MGLGRWHAMRASRRRPVARAAHRERRPDRSARPIHRDAARTGCRATLADRMRDGPWTPVWSSDRHQHICVALALWNGRDPFLKERLFGVTNPEGNHGEDVKECYFYLDNTPTHSYMKCLYKYPQAAFPYAALVEENRRRD